MWTSIRKSRPDSRRLAWTRCLLLVLLIPSAVEPLDQATVAGRNRPEHHDKPYVVVVSLDGFRADYLDRFRLPNLQRVTRQGTRAASMIPVFPSLTFPNHYSLVTGLFPDRHGIVANSFYDPVRKEKYSMHEDSVRDGSWYRGEPIWVTAESQGMVAACFFWPGSEAAIHGVRPTLARRYDGKLPNRERVNGVLEWLKLPADRRPHVVTVYFSAIDDASHVGSVGHRRVEDAARLVDRSIGELLDGLDTLPIKDRIYVLITSDHGMTDVTRQRSIAIESLTNLDGVIHTFVGPVTSLHIKDSDAARASQLRDALNTRLKNGRAYLRAELPARLRYAADPRAGDVVVVMDEGWVLRRSLDLRGLVRTRWGMHGWDPELPSMQAIFLAMGPNIRAGQVIDRIRNVDVYPLITELLGLRAPAGIDGRPGDLYRRLTSNGNGTPPQAAFDLGPRTRALPDTSSRTGRTGSDLDFRIGRTLRLWKFENRDLTPRIGGVRSLWKFENRDLTPGRRMPERHW